eukprot:g3405.t1
MNVWTKKRLQQDMQDHRERLQNMKKHIDTDPPYSCKTKIATQRFFTNERVSNIRHENKGILDRIHSIRSPVRKIMNKSRSQPHLYGGSSDGNGGGINSNLGARRRFLQKVNLENRYLLDRIRNEKSSYNLQKFGEEHDRRKATFENRKRNVSRKKKKNKAHVEAIDELDQQVNRLKNKYQKSIGSKHVWKEKKTTSKDRGGRSNGSIGKGRRAKTKSRSVILRQGKTFAGMSSIVNVFYVGSKLAFEVYFSQTSEVHTKTLNPIEIQDLVERYNQEELLAPCNEVRLCKFLTSLLSTFTMDGKPVLIFPDASPNRRKHKIERKAFLHEVKKTELKDGSVKRW